MSHTISNLVSFIFCLLSLATLCLSLVRFGFPKIKTGFFHPCVYSTEDITRHLVESWSLLNDCFPTHTENPKISTNIGNTFLPRNTGLEGKKIMCSNLIHSLYIN